MYYSDQIHRLTFDNYEVADGVICNFTATTQKAKSYLRKMGLSGLPARVIFASALLKEELAEADLVTQLFGSLQVYLNLGSKNYVAILAPEFLWQYQLFFREVGLYIEEYTSQMIYWLNYLQQTMPDQVSMIETLSDLQNLISAQPAKVNFEDLIYKIVF